MANNTESVIQTRVRTEHSRNAANLDSRVALNEAGLECRISSDWEAGDISKRTQPKTELSTLSGTEQPTMVTAICREFGVEG